MTSGVAVVFHDGKPGRSLLGSDLKTESMSGTTVETARHCNDLMEE